MADPASELRKIVIVNTADEGGGAEVMSMAMLDGFLELGIDTWLLVGNKKTSHPRVMTFFESPFLDYRPFARAHHPRITDWRRRIDSSLGLESFSHAYANRIPELTGTPPDLVVCHNLHGGYFDLRAIVPLSHRIPVALRLFDSWLFTGHCAKPLQCPRWETGCGHCPDLAAPPAIRRDATRFNWHRKRRILDGGRFFASAESHWMIDRAKRSILAPAVRDWKLIRGGIDLTTFSPGSRQDARRQLGIAADEHVVVHVSHLGSANPAKDFSTVRRALVELAHRDPARHIVLLVVGAEGPDETIGPGIVLRRYPYERSRIRLAQYYRAADVAVHAALDETYGLVVAEALACGTPVITASTGGVHEIVEHGRSGLIVPARNPPLLGQALSQLLYDPDRRAAMGRAAAEFARGRLDRRDMIAALHAWCVQVRTAWKTEPYGALRPELAN